MNIEKIGRLADEIDNLVAASKAPLSPQLHLQQIVMGLKKISNELKTVYTQETGENPWE